MPGGKICSRVKAVEVDVLNVMKSLEEKLTVALGSKSSQCKYDDTMLPVLGF